MLEVVLLDLAPSDEADEAARADRAFNEQVRPGARGCTWRRAARPCSRILFTAMPLQHGQAYLRPVGRCSNLLHSLHFSVFSQCHVLDMRASTAMLGARSRWALRMGV